MGRALLLDPIGVNEVCLLLRRIFPIPFSRRSASFEASDFRKKAAKTLWAHLILRSATTHGISSLFLTKSGPRHRDENGGNGVSVRVVPHLSNSGQICFSV